MSVGSLLEWRKRMDALHGDEHSKTEAHVLTPSAAWMNGVDGKLEGSLDGAVGSGSAAGEAAELRELRRNVDRWRETRTRRGEQEVQESEGEKAMEGGEAEDIPQWRLVKRISPLPIGTVIY